MSSNTKNKALEYAIENMISVTLQHWKQQQDEHNQAITNQSSTQAPNQSSSHANRWGAAQLQAVINQATEDLKPSPLTRHSRIQAM